MYLVTLPPNKLERNGRVAGWHRVPLSREDKRTLSDLIGNLKDATLVCGSDLDSDAVRLIANELHTDYREEFKYRRLNVGKQHGAKANHAMMLLEHRVQQWKDNPIVPLHGGDSWTSLSKRLSAITALLDRPEKVVFVTDARTATLIIYGKPEALLMNGSGLQPSKVYKVEKPSGPTQ